MPPCPRFVVHHLQTMYKVNASRSHIALITVAQVQLVHNTLANCLVKMNGKKTQARLPNYKLQHAPPSQPHAC